MMHYEVLYSQHAVEINALIYGAGRDGDSFDT